MSERQPPDRIVFVIRGNAVVRARMVKAAVRKPVTYRDHKARQLIRVELEKIVGKDVMTSVWQRPIKVNPALVLDDAAAARKRLSLAKRRSQAAKKRNEELTIEDAAVAIAEGAVE